MHELVVSVAIPKQVSQYYLYALQDYLCNFLYVMWICTMLVPFESQLLVTFVSLLSEYSLTIKLSRLLLEKCINS